MVSRTFTEPAMNPGENKEKLGQKQMSLRWERLTSVDVDAGDLKLFRVPKISKHLNTPTIKVYVGFGSDLKIYWGLLEGRLLPTVGKHYSEEYVKHRCRFPEETTQIFDIYAQFIYGADLPRDLDTLTLLKLYGFGLRSFTKELRHATVDRMITALGLGRDDPNYLGNEEVCDLLLIMPHEIPEPDENQDPMADLIFWYAARRLTTLKKMTTFNHLIHDYPEISCGILMKACDADYHLPGV